MERSVTVDPSPFTSTKRLSDLLKVLGLMKSDLFCPLTKVVLPTYLYNELFSITEKKGASDVLPEIFRGWLPFYSQDHIEAIIRGIERDETYMDTINKFFNLFKPIPASEYVSDLTKLGSKSVHRDEATERLGRIVGEIVFEMMALSDRLQAVILSFGEITATLIARLGVTVIKTHSKFKANVKKRANIRRVLRVTGYALSFDSLRRFIEVFQPINFPSIGDVGLGLIIVADG